jgi:hypothetical protein
MTLRISIVIMLIVGFSYFGNKPQNLQLGIFSPTTPEASI